MITGTSMRSFFQQTKWCRRISSHAAEKKLAAGRFLYVGANGSPFSLLTLKKLELSEHITSMASGFFIVSIFVTTLNLRNAKPWPVTIESVDAHELRICNKTDSLWEGIRSFEMRKYIGNAQGRVEEKQRM